jgi:hypothetical protein
MSFAAPYCKTVSSLESTSRFRGATVRERNEIAFSAPGFSKPDVAARESSKWMKNPFGAGCGARTRACRVHTHVNASYVQTSQRLQECQRGTRRVRAPQFFNGVPMGRRPIQVDENDYLSRAEARLQGGSPGPTTS